MAAASAAAAAASTAARRVLDRLRTVRPAALPPRDAKVVVAMSGGVDSSVAACLLRAQGYTRLEGWHMRTWDARDQDGGPCAADQDYVDVQRVCAALAMPCRQVDLVKEYWNEVFVHLVADYERGVTPNPDLWCNREIKFHAFWERARAAGAVAMATGHYAHVGAEGADRFLLRGTDRTKDQSYFLAGVPRNVLAHALFPVGGLSKPEVRAIAHDAGLVTADKPKSVGICFIGQRKFAPFLEGYLRGTPGAFVSVTNGSVVGQHRGLPFYTVGQGARISGATERWFVVDKDVRSNVIRVAPDTAHPSLFASTLTARRPMWLVDGVDDALDEGLDCEAQIRYMDPPLPCTVRRMPDGAVRVTLESAVRGIAPGQAAVFFAGEVCLGHAIVADTPR